MNPNKEPAGKPKRQWGEDDAYDERNYQQAEWEEPVFEDDYVTEDESAFDYGNDTFREDDYEPEVNEEEANQLTKDIMEKNYPGLGDLDKNQHKQLMDSLRNYQYIGCAQVAVFSGIQGAILGTIIGGVQTVFAGMGSGVMRQAGFGRFVWQQSKLQGKQFGIWLSAFTGMKCTLTVSRQKQDILNVFSSGFFAGSVATLYSRNPPLIAMNGLGSAVIVSALHFVGFAV